MVAHPNLHVAAFCLLLVFCNLYDHRIPLLTPMEAGIHSVIRPARKHSDASAFKYATDGKYCWWCVNRNSLLPPS